MAEVTRIEYDRKIMEKEKQKKMSEIEDQSSLARVRAKADAEFYNAEKQAESNKVCMWCAQKTVVLYLPIHNDFINLRYWLSI